ncbi:MAG: Molybdenum cofactor guanylyltransferase [Burkholderiaceae bacterium]|jgi:molybdopterin-guanine dinucleotide biosynthesis protein A|nr:MAG: Molybdenum cofactor guanylyltransferase [Burkholderiaceae bacterium]
MIASSDITGLVLAGGRGSRMGGVDKGLQAFGGVPLAQHALRRLQPQVGPVLINANRNAAVYESFGAPVWPDLLPDFAGPLAGFMTGLAHCETPYLVTVPCDSPLFPTDLVARLAAALKRDGAELAMAAGFDRPGATEPRTQPVFCLLHQTLRASLERFTAAGGRKIDAWTAQHRTVIVAFDAPGDTRAFLNANTEDELRALEPR